MAGVGAGDMVEDVEKLQKKSTAVRGTGRAKRGGMGRGKSAQDLKKALGQIADYSEEGDVSIEPDKTTATDNCAFHDAPGASEIPGTKATDYITSAPINSAPLVQTDPSISNGTSTITNSEQTVSITKISMDTNGHTAPSGIDSELNTNKPTSETQATDTDTIVTASDTAAAVTAVSEEPMEEGEVVKEDKPDVKEEESKEPTELDKYWKSVKDNPSDFTGWTYLLQYVEQENKVDSAREAFEAFFARYPYCYGYWKKYSDLEKRAGNVQVAQEVYEKAVRAIPLSADLWLHYVTFLSTRLEEEGIDSAEIQVRELYERAIETCGGDFRSDKLWEAYINFELEKKNLQRVTGIYDRLLALPTQLYSHNFDNFKSFVNANVPKDILSLDEFLELRKQVVTITPELQPGVPADDELSPENAPAVDDAPPGEEKPPGEDSPPPGEDKAAKTEEVSGDPETEALRKKIIEIRTVVHKTTEEEVSKRWQFEEGIRRPYFHVKPLEKAQLKNWKDYLDWEIENGTHKRVLLLFERCMISCALYEEFWMKYAKYMEEHSVKGVREVYKRACTIHLPKKPTINLAWAAFEEIHGNPTSAFEVLHNLNKQIPQYSSIALRRIGLERRQGNVEDVEGMFEEYIDNSQNTETATFYRIKYARFLMKVKRDVAKARTVLNTAIDNDKKNAKLYNQLIDLEYQCNPIDETRMNEALDRALGANFSQDEKVKFSRRKLEFNEDFGSDVSRLMEVYEEHQKVMKEYNATKKRKSTSTSEEAAPKKTKVEVPPPTSSTAASTSGYSNTGYDQSGYYQNTWGNYNQGYYGAGGWGGYNTGYY
ncbi:unnamed protein product [Owenia fusiformis]|uniref:Pre-mRNA-processing factor 39 n=1 Tax=Owenia fusiformis TaxID=6347 RepID=A0A8J1UM06_OWEFU|nr:unnamed protein product [Owenia fusiformis]